MAQKAPHYATGMVFGVFDGLHQGHKYFLTTAAKRCQQLVVVVTLPEIVRLLKKRLPRYTYTERITSIRNFNPKLKTVRSDKTLGIWNVLKKYPPDMIFLGHDQEAIGAELHRLHIPFIFLKAHHPEKHKSSITHKRLAK